MRSLIVAVSNLSQDYNPGEPRVVRNFDEFRCEISTPGSVWTSRQSDLLFDGATRLRVLLAELKQHSVEEGLA